MRHIISLLLENEPGALSRVVGLFSQRNYNIESLTVAPTEDPTLSRLTLTTVGHDDFRERLAPCRIENAARQRDGQTRVPQAIGFADVGHVLAERDLLGEGDLRDVAGLLCRDIAVHGRLQSRARAHRSGLSSRRLGAGLRGDAEQHANRGESSCHHGRL